MLWLGSQALLDTPTAPKRESMSISGELPISTSMVSEKRLSISPVSTKRLVSEGSRAETLVETGVPKAPGRFPGLSELCG
jgi:hypothetical protein